MLEEKTSIKKNATPHMLLHTFISMLTEAKVDLPTIMQKVGHDKLKIYSHVTNKIKKMLPPRLHTCTETSLKTSI